MNSLRLDRNPRRQAPGGFKQEEAIIVPSIRARLRTHWPLLLVISLFWVSIGTLFLISLAQNEGHLSYIFDDAYIHMAIAKNLAEHGVWGVTKFAFSSSSSSLLWTLLLSLAYRVLGVNELDPLLLNVLAGTGLIIFTYSFLRSRKLHPAFIMVLMLLIVFVTPLPFLVFSGLEHTLHTLVTLAVIALSAKVLSTKADVISNRRDLLALFAFVPILVATRYEGLFLLAVLACLFVLRRRISQALILCALGILPIALFGLVSVAQGWYPLPNSVLIKGNMPDFSSLSSVLIFAGYAILQAAINPLILLLLCISGLLLFLRIRATRTIWQESTIWGIVFIVTTVLHLQFASTFSYYRYTGYIIAMGIVANSMLVNEYLPLILPLDLKKYPPKAYVALGLAVLLTFSFLAERGIGAFATIPQSTTNVYEQQYQMASFLKEYYQGEGVAANDIGAISFFADVQLLDVWGLANMDVGRARLAGTYNTQDISQLAKAKNVKVAMVYDGWFKGKIGGLPPEWIKVAEWKTPNLVALGGDVVSIYATDRTNAETLVQNLRDFSPQLTKGVQQTFVLSDGVQ